MTRPCLVRLLSPLFLALLCLGFLRAASLGAAEPAATRVPGLRGDVLGQIHDAESKLTQLAEAIPAGRFLWRPAEGVRTTGEVLVHVASGNYFYPSLWGAHPPAGVDAGGLEKLGGDRDKAIAAMKDSFVYLQKQIAALSDADLDRSVDMLGRKMTVRGLLLHATTHAHEHLGQIIAYARMNGIVPPWSQKGD